MEDVGKHFLPKSRMTGAWINALGIIAGGVFGLAARKPLSAQAGQALKILLGVATLWFGIKLAWTGINGSFGLVVKEIAIVLLAMMLGKLTGKLLRFQKFSNSVGRRASEAMTKPSPEKKLDRGFWVATSLFCIGPLGLLASAQEGLNGFSPVFIVKAAVDGLAAFAFCQTFGWAVILSAIPVFLVESLLIRLAQAAEGVMHQRPWPLIDETNVTNGLLMFCVSMLILGLKKIEVADYFPSLVFAPLLTWWLWH